LSYWPALKLLVDDLGHNACTNGTAAFAYREAQSVFHGDRRNQRRRQLDVVTRHDHLNTFRQLTASGDVCRTEVELRTVTGKERGVTTTLFLAQHIDLALKLGVRRD